MQFALHLIHTDILARCSNPSTARETVLNGFHYWSRQKSPGQSRGVTEIQTEPVVLSGKTLAGNRLHHVTKTIQLAERRVYVWGNAKALEFFMNDRRSKDSMLIK